MSWEALGGNPVPGDPGVAQRLATGYGEICDQAEQITSRLRALDGGSGPDVWRGQAAEAFRDKLAKVGPDLITMATHYRQASEALRDFARSLEEAQTTARRAESEAGAALIDRDAAAARRDMANRDARTADGTALLADGKIVAARTQAMVAAPLDPTYQVAMQDWERRVAAQRDAARSQAADARRRAGAAASEAASAKARFEAAKRLAGQAEAVRNDAARTAAARIKAADAPGYDDRSLWDKVWDGAAEGVRKVSRKIDEITASPVFASMMNVLSDVGDVVGAMGTALSFLSFIPGVAPFAAALLVTAAAFKGAAFLGTLISAKYGNASWDKVRGRGIDFGLSLVSGGSFVKGFAQAAAKVAKPGSGAVGLWKAGMTVRTGPVTTLVGQVKRSIWYDDAAKATGRFRSFEAAAPFGERTTRTMGILSIDPAKAFLLKTDATAFGVGVQAADMLNKSWSGPQDFVKDLSHLAEPEDKDNTRDKVDDVIITAVGEVLAR